jgi:hypothetical protein
MTVSLNQLVIDFDVKKIPMSFVRFLLYGFKVQGICAKL